MEFQHFPMCLTTLHKFRRPPPWTQIQQCPRHIDRTGENGLDPASHCAKQAPSRNGDKGLVAHCDALHKHEPKAPSCHSEAPTSHRACRTRCPPAMQTHPHSGDQHLARTFQVLRPSQQRWFPKHQNHIDDTHPQSLLASRHVG